MFSKAFLKRLLVLAALIFISINQSWAEEFPDTTYPLLGEKVYPEGIAYDKKTDSLFVGSFYKGEIQRIRKGTVTIFIPAGQDDLHSVVGMSIDVMNRRLWVCNSEAGASQRATPDSIGKASVHIYDLDSRYLLRRLTLTQQSGHFCNDIALDASGNAYITDSFSPMIWKVNGSKFVLSEWVRDDRFSGEGFNLNGIQITPDDKYVIAVKMNSGQLFRISVKDRSIIEIKLNRPIDAGDGMVFSDKHELFVIEGFGAKEPGIARVLFSNDYGSAIVSSALESHEMKVPTTATIANGNLFVVNSQFNHLFKPEVSGPPEATFTVAGFDLKQLKQAAKGGHMKKEVLMIVTSHGRLGETGKQTGVYLSELAHPYEVFSKAGWGITVASPLGGDVPIDPKSISPELANYVQNAKNTLLLGKVKVEDYDAFFVVGGHGTMWDLPNNEDLQRLLPAAYAKGKVVSAVCHGPAALVYLKNPDGSYMIQNKHVTGFTSEEEQAVGLTNVVPFLLEDALKNAGAVYEKAPNWQEKVVVEGHLVTGQNPASAKGAAEAVVRILSGK